MTRLSRRSPIRLSAISAVVCLVQLVHSAESSRVQIQMDTAEAEAALKVLDEQAAGHAPTEEDWRSIFDSRAYRRLKEREASLKRSFTDEDFRDFLLTGEAAGRGAELRRTLKDWQRADFNAIAAKMLAYLPPQATIRATIYPVIKPRHNSFVWDLDEDPAIFFFLDPAVTAAQFENTAAHELHHVGLHSISRSYRTMVAALPEHARMAAEVMGAFGEGFAMLAAAGSSDVHPHAESNPQDRARWDRDMANFDADLRKVDGFLRQIVNGKLSEAEVDEQAMAFFGIQGPWYTVGYRMAAAVEKRRGRPALLQCMEDPRRLLATWNQIAGEAARWSDDLLAAVKAEPVAGLLP